MAEASRIVAGAMSGTSADGVDVALVRITGRGVGMRADLLHHHAQAYDADLRRRIFAIRDVGGATLRELAQLARDVSLAYAKALGEALVAAKLTAGNVAAVAAHGQTLFHNPPSTIQWFDPALVAAEVGCPVVSDFRRADCAAGGQGAPLVPFADYVLFRHPEKDRVLLNLGGIANVTYLPAGASLSDVIAFDTGPANCISDHLCRTMQPDGPGYDERGKLAARGRSLLKVHALALADPYFEKLPPKSTDGPTMIALFERAVQQVHGDERPPLEDLLATARQLTVDTIHSQLMRLANIRPMVKSDLEMIASGGGTRNDELMKYLCFEFPPRVTTIEEHGVPSEAKEALAFALLGAATLDGEPSNVPSATGAKRAAVLGSITPRP